MKSILLSLLVAFCWLSLTEASVFRAQSELHASVYGTISDLLTNEPLSNVNVFLANTMIGTASAPDGSYRITNIPPGIYTLVFSMMGYDLKTIELQIRAIQTRKYDIKLTPAPISGKEVIVIASVPKAWQKNLQRFTKIFLGESKNARESRIINPYVLDFTTDKEKKELIATSDSFVIVENRALGYQLRIWLDRFQYNYRTGHCVYGMFARYRELNPRDKKETIKWKKKRWMTYQGSFRHFLSALARQELMREDFKIYIVRTLKAGTVNDESMVLPGAEHKSYSEPQISEPESETLDFETDLSVTEFVTGTPIPIQVSTILFSDSSNSTMRLQFENYLGVRFKKFSLKVLKNFIKLNYASAEIDTLGNLLTPYAITKYGIWANEKVADSLPLDDKPGD